MNQFCAGSEALGGGVTVDQFCFSATARRLRLDNRLPVRCLANAKLVVGVCLQAEAYLGGKFVLLSGYRSPEVNRAVGGKLNSYHLFGLAIDCRFDGVPFLDAARKLAVSRLPICELEAKQTSLHIAYGEFRTLRLFRQYVARGEVVRVDGFPIDGVRG
jgi:hypothetical protein